MDVNYFNLSGGINQSSTKTELGVNPKVIYWSDSENIEIYNNKGLIKQKGNTILLQLPEQESIIGLREMESEDALKLVIVTKSGKIYIYALSSGTLTLLDKTLSGKNVLFANFLRGVVISTESDEMFYIKDNDSYDIIDCNLKDRLGKVVYPDCISIYRGRLWCAKESTVYYSALGTYNEFTLENDAGYINDFHTDTADITGMQNYKEYLAIYKKNRVYLLSGSSPADFSLTPFADKGSVAKNSLINVDNKQYFLSNGIYALEQVGELNQIRLGSEISLNIKNEFDKFDTSRIKNTIALHYQNKSQTWYFFPYLGDDYFHTIWINDYLNRAWFKRVLPQNITAACNFNSYIVTGDDQGRIYYEDYGTTFDGKSINFLWKSPFLSLGNVHHRKLIDEFYFVLDDLHDNNFDFSVYKDYDSNYSEGAECICSRHFNQLIWADEYSSDCEDFCWAVDDAEVPVWSIGTDVLEKAEIFGSCYSVQLCIEGKNFEDNCAIIGLQFREIYNDD
ncbi:hypothetical protein HDR58_05005 [bacterium]|nr:hypothetical protein [bacterium]